MANEKILVVDDDKNICELLRLYLVKEGYNVTMVHDGAAALAEFDKLHPDLVLLDVMMPVMDGWEVCRKIRAKDNTPIIMLTAKGEEEDKIKGLSAGADDYVTKPFSVPELMARVKTNLRRAPELLPQKELVFEDIRMDLAEKKDATLVIEGRHDPCIVHRAVPVVEAAAALALCQLGPTEFRLLRMLMETPGKVFSREFLLKNVWGNNIYVESRTVDVHIRRLRKSLNEFGPDYIRTVRATGYAIDNSLSDDGGEDEK